MKNVESSSSSGRNDPIMIDPYYTSKAFYTFAPLAVVYTIIANSALLVAKPFSFIRRNFIPMNMHVPIEERFTLTTRTTRTNDGDEIKAIDNMESVNHTVIVTGSNTGIGFETASSLVELGYDVILACRSRDKGERAAQKINSRFGGGGTTQPLSPPSSSSSFGEAIFLHPLDLSSFNSVRSFVKVFQSKYGHLNILVNNAGINSSGTSVDGMDLCFQTNFLGHYLLTRLLLPHLLKAKNHFPSNDGGIAQNGVEAGRVVNLSSVTHHFAGASEERRNGVKTHGIHNEEWWRGCTEPTVSENTYKESKMAALLLTHELNRRYSNQGLRAVSVNPGAVNSDIWRDFPAFMMKVHDMIYLTSKQGSRPSYAAAIGDCKCVTIYLLIICMFCQCFLIQYYYIIYNSAKRSSVSPTILATLGKTKACPTAKIFQIPIPSLVFIACTIHGNARYLCRICDHRLPFAFPRECCCNVECLWATGRSRKGMNCSSCNN